MVVFRGLNHVEKRDDGLIAGLDEQDLESPVEGNAPRNGGVDSGTSSNYEEVNQETIRLRISQTRTNPVHVGEVLILVPVDQGSGLVYVCRGETLGADIVAGQLVVDVVPDGPLFKNHHRITSSDHSDAQRPQL